MNLNFKLKGVHDSQCSQPSFNFSSKLTIISFYNRISSHWWIDSNLKIIAAHTTSDDEMFPPTPNSKISFHIANNGTGLQTLSCSLESKYGDLPHRRTASFEDQCLFDRLSGWSVDFNDTSEAISKSVGIVSNMSLSSDNLSLSSFQCVVHYLEAVHERHRMLYHATCWEVSEHERREALAHVMREDSKRDYLKAEQEVQFLLDILGQCVALSHQPVANFSAQVCNHSKTSRCTLRITELVQNVDDHL
ncbi:uncharacterized protein EDB91DRAFT_1087844 [Suillus paluster]|uniref:uncharacterized protein n=1 Tax=Suillus paluster TaxID=48578 RepID=UPI001B87CEAB|nr:uncharacterized protein EDB91DRAFT_1087844 [Suillus paluster]KAG1723298.1 hypothetical protein EDB91DRAFT_1087844 [Suillus paluster]